MRAGGVVCECECDWHAEGEQGAAGAAASIAAEAATEGTAHEQARLLALERQLLNVDPVVEVRAHPIIFWTVTNSLFLLCKQDEDGRDSSQDRNADADNLSMAAASDADIEGESLECSGISVPGSGFASTDTSANATLNRDEASTIVSSHSELGSNLN